MSGIAGIYTFFDLFNNNLVSSSNPLTIAIKLTNFTDWTSFYPYNNYSSTQQFPALTAGFGIKPLNPLQFNFVYLTDNSINGFGFGAFNSTNQSSYFQSLINTTISNKILIDYSYQGLGLPSESFLLFANLI